MGSSDNNPDQTRLDFVNTVAKAFAFLADLGFLQSEALPTIVRYKKGEVEVRVYYGRRSYELGFEIVRHGEKYSMSELMRLADPEAAARYRNFAATTQAGLTDGLVKLAELATKYAGLAMQGAPEFFTALEDRRRSWSKTFSLDVLEQQLRPKANEAFRRGSYQEAAELYERFMPRLTRAEAKKLAIAKDRTVREG
jgi:hypothetical protein